MDPITSAAVIGAGSQILGGITDMFGSSKANSSSRKLAAMNNDFQKEMSSTVYRRGMEDMKRAGLNPILAYQQGGASSPSGNVAPVQNTMSGMADGIKKAGNSAVALKRLEAEINNINATTDKSRADASLATEQLNTQKTQQTLNMEQAGAARAAAHLSGVTAGNKGMFTPLRESVSKISSDAAFGIDKLYNSRKKDFEFLKKALKLNGFGNSAKRKF